MARLESVASASEVAVSAGGQNCGVCCPSEAGAWTDVGSAGGSKTAEKPNIQSAFSGKNPIDLKLRLTKKKKKCVGELKIRK